MVWLETQSVTLADGSTQQVLVPRVYVRARRGDIAPVGGLLAGNSVVGTVRELKNSGTIAGRTVVQITADHQLHTGLVRGQDIALHSKNDMLLQGAQIRADKSLNLKAGRDLKIETTTSSSTSSAGSNRFSHTGLDRVATLYAGNSLSLQAGQDLKLTAAQVNSDGTLSAKAGRDLKLDTVNTAQSETLNWSGKGYDLQRARSSSQDVGSVLNAKGDVQLRAGNDIDLQAAQVSSQAQLSALAGGNINIAAGQATQSDYDYEHKTGKTLFSRSSSTKIRQSDSQSTVASTIEGHSVLMKAGQDVNVKGSNVLADAALQLSAGRDVNILAAEEKQRSSYFEETKKSGLMGSGGIGFTIGKRQQSLDQQGTQTTAAASTVGSLGGNVSIIAGQKYTQSGSDVLAPKGDIDILAKKVDITEAQESATSRTEQKMKQSGLTIALKGGIIDTIQNVAQAVKGVADGGSKRSQLLHSLTAYAQGMNLKEQVEQVKDAYQQNGIMNNNADANGSGEGKSANNGAGAAAASGIKVGISYGQSSSESVSTSQSASGKGSRVKAGGKVNIKATEGDITVQGSEVQAGEDLLLDAKQRINLLASTDSTSERSTNKSQSASVGASIGMSSSGISVSLDLAASQGRGRANSDSVTSNNSLVQAGKRVQLRSGSDTNIAGAQVQGQTVKADIGGDLNVASLQDRANSAARQNTSGFGLSIPVYGAGSISGSVSNAQQKSNSNYQSVFQQSGIAAGDGGFDIKVSGNTDLKGAAITSTAAASDNHLVTQTLSTSDLQNSSQASASSSGISLGTDMLAGKYAVAKSVMGNALNRGQVDSSDNSTTHSVISAAQVTVGNKTTDTSQAELKDSQGKTVTTDASNAHRALQKADVAGLQELAQEKQANKMLAFNALTQLTTDLVNKQQTADQKILLQRCDAQGQNCQPSAKVDASNIKVVDGKAYVFNNGIFNDEKEALANAAKQSSSEANQQGVYVIINPYTGNPVAEILAAGWDKLNEVMKAALPISNASQANIDIRNTTKTQGGVVDSFGNSRGSLTDSIATSEQVNQGVQNAAIGTITFNGAAANAQRMANQVNIATSGTGVVQQATHKDDLISTVIGGNTATGGVDASFVDAHTSYTGSLQPKSLPNDKLNPTREKTDKVWGPGNISTPIIVKPTNTEVTQ